MSNQTQRETELPEIDPAGAGPSDNPPYENNPESVAPPPMECSEVPWHPLDAWVDPEEGQHRNDFPRQVTPGGTYEI